jgi:hypothetical protein
MQIPRVTELTRATAHPTLPSRRPGGGAGLVALTRRKQVGSKRAGTPPRCARPPSAAHLLDDARAA